jgi:hypothetical protein
MSVEKLLHKLLIGTARSGFIENLSQALAAQQSVSSPLALIVMNLVTPKPAAKHQFLFSQVYI